MFEVGFGELLLIALVALVVIGPEQLPRVARTAGLWLGRARRMIVSVKADIEREIKAEELKEVLNKQALSHPLEELMEDGKAAMQNLHRTTTEPATVARQPDADTLPIKKSVE